MRRFKLRPPHPFSFAASGETASVFQNGDNGDDQRESKNVSVDPAAKANLHSTGKGN